MNILYYICLLIFIIPMFHYVKYIRIKLARKTENFEMFLRSSEKNNILHEVSFYTYYYFSNKILIGEIPIRLNDKLNTDIQCVDEDLIHAVRYIIKKCGVRNYELEYTRLAGLDTVLDMLVLINEIVRQEKGVEMGPLGKPTAQTTSMATDTPPNPTSE